MSNPRQWSFSRSRKEKRKRERAAVKPLTLFTDFLATVPEGAKAAAEKLIHFLLDQGIPPKEIKIAHIPSGPLKGVFALNYPPPHACKGPAGQLDMNSACITVCTQFPHTHLKHEDEETASQLSDAIGKGVLTFDFHPFNLPTKDGDESDKRTHAPTLAAEKLKGGQTALRTVYHLVHTFVLAVVRERNQDVSASMSTSTTTSTSTPAPTTPPKPFIVTYGLVAEGIYKELQKKADMDNSGDSLLYVGSLPHPEAVINTKALKKDNEFSLEDEAGNEEEGEKKAGDKGEDENGDPNDGATEMDCRNVGKLKVKKVVVDPTDIAREGDQPTVTEQEPIESTTALGTLSSLDNAKKFDRVLCKMIRALGIKVTFDMCRMYTDLLDGRSKILDVQRAAKTKNWLDVWETRANLFNNRGDAHLVGEIVITPHMAFRLGLLRSDKRSNAELLEAYQASCSAAGSALFEDDGYWGVIAKHLNGRGEELTGVFKLSPAQAFRLGLEDDEQRSNAELLEVYHDVCSALLKEDGYWGVIAKGLNDRGEELTGGRKISPAEAFRLGLAADDPRLNAEIVAACSAKRAARFQEGGHFYGVATILNGRDADLVDEHRITPAMVFHLGLAADDPRSNSQIMEEGSSEMSRRAASKIGSQYFVEGLDRYYDGGVRLFSQDDADLVVRAIVKRSSKHEPPGLTTGSILYFESMIQKCDGSTLYHLIKYSVSGSVADEVSLKKKVRIGKDNILKLLPVEKQEEYKAVVAAAKKRKKVANSRRYADKTRAKKKAKKAN